MMLKGQTMIDVGRRLASMLLILPLLTWVGCDSSEDGDDDFDDTEVLVGTWNATAIKVDAGTGAVDILPLLGLSFEITLASNGQASLLVTEEDGSTTSLSGDYSVNETNKTITLNDDELDEDLVLTYSIEDEDTVRVELDGSDLDDIGIELPDLPGFDFGNVTIIVELERAGT
jgi:hypothetical protein